MLKIAIPKESSFDADIQTNLRKCGIEQTDQKQGYFHSNDFPATVVPMGYSTIINALDSAVVDLAIVGYHDFINSNRSLSVLYSLNSKHHNFSIYTDNRLNIKDISSLHNKTIACNYPNLLLSFLKKRKIKMQVVEIDNPLNAFLLGLVDCFADIVDYNRGQMLGLIEVECITESYPIVVARDNISTAKRMFAEELIDRIAASQMALNKKVIEVYSTSQNAKKIVKILEEIDSDVVRTTSDNDKKSVVFRAVMEECQFWDIKNRLFESGAEKSLIIPIEKIVV